MIQDAAEAITGVFGALQCHLDGFGDGQAEAAGTVRVAFERGTSRGRQCRRRREAFRSPCVHHQAAIRLLLVADLDHEDLHVEPEMASRKGNGRPPLASTRFSSDVLDPLFVVVVCLRYGGIGLVRAGRRHALVLEEYPGRRIESLFEPIGAYQRGGTPDTVYLLHLFGYVYVTFGGHLLTDQFIGKDCLHLFESYRFLGCRVQWRQRFVGHVGHDVVPLLGHLALGELEFLCFHKSETGYCSNV